MPKMDKTGLIRAALAARKKAVAPYSKFQVGAALLTKSGQVIAGANVESASYGLTCCAERIALFKALTDGHRDFAAIAVVSAISGGAMPCGACRQLLSEYASNSMVWIADSRRPRVIREFCVKDLLPHAFTF
jgi:cytidine deaminase